MDQKRQSIEARFDGIVVFFFCLLIYFLPISIALTETMAGFVVFFFVIKKVLLNTHDLRLMPSATRGEKIKFVLSSVALANSPLNKPMGIFILVAFISSVLSQYFVISIIAFFAKLMEGYLLYLAFADCVKIKAHIRNFVVVYFVSALLMGVNGLTQYITHTDFVRGTPLVDGRVSSSLRHANDFGAYLTLVIPILLSILLMPFGRLPWIKEWKEGSFGSHPVFKGVIGIIFILAIVSLGLTYSRGAWVAFLFGLVAFMLFRKKNFFLIVGVGVMFLLIFLPIMAQTRNVSLVSDNLLYRGDNPVREKEAEGLNPIEKFFFDFNGMGRIGFWSEAIGLIKRSPALGSGLNTYAKMGTQFGYAHNCYLQMAAEIGILGLGAFLTLLWFLFFGAYKALSAVKDPFLNAALAGAMGGLVGFLVQSFFDTSFYSVQLGNLMWVFMGLIVAVQRIGTARNN